MSHTGEHGYAGPTVNSPGNHSPGLPIRVGAKEAPLGSGEQCTLSNALMLCMTMAHSDLRMALLAQLRPLWIQALAANPVNHKFLFANGRLVRKRALPLALAVPLVVGWIPVAIATIRQEVNDLAASLAAWDQALQAAVGNGGDVAIVSDDEDEDDM